jgi:hypothetical protein
MTRRGAPPARSLTRRRRDLLLASGLARNQALGAFEELAEQADTVADQVVSLRRWLSNPLVWTAASASGAFLLGIVLRRPPAAGRAPRTGMASVLRWGWLAWRLWRSLSPTPAQRRSG